MRSDQILARTMKYGDELTLLEQGMKVEREQFRESTYKMSTLAQLLKSRLFSQINAVRHWQRWNEYVPDPPIIPAGPNPHGWECPCDRCHEGVLRLLRDVGVIPKARGAAS